MLADSHAHIDDVRFDGDRDAVLQRAWDAGVRHILTIGNGRGPDDMGCAIPISEAHDWIRASAGIHPHDAVKAEGRHFDELETFARSGRIVAIGEAGLDYYYDNSPREVQRHVFRRQVRLARDLGLPLIVHTRDADEDTEKILQEERPARGVIHCFTSGPRLAEFAIQLGFCISFSGIVTFPKAREIAAIAKGVPADRILVETDCPYLAPVPHRGKRNEPSFVADTAQLLASLRGVDCSEFQTCTTANFMRLFNLS
jgi:TatD DNase family protein